jgi:hypothetical protein
MSLWVQIPLGLIVALLWAHVFRYLWRLTFRVNHGDARSESLPPCLIALVLWVALAMGSITCISLASADTEECLAPPAD